MGIFERIKDAIFGSSAKAETPAPTTVETPATPSAGTAPSVTDAKPAAPPPGTVDVAAILDGLAKQKKQKLAWRKSIVDLMKLLDLDSSLAARKKLATELHYTGDMKKSAPMNIWLHKQVMIKLAENGGKVPAELRK